MRWKVLDFMRFYNSYNLSFNSQDYTLPVSGVGAYIHPRMALGTGGEKSRNWVQACKFLHACTQFRQILPLQGVGVTVVWGVSAGVGVVVSAGGIPVGVSVGVGV